MIKYFQNQEIDTEKWDECIQLSFNGLPYAYSWFLDLMHDGWCGLVDGDYERVMPITPGRKLGIAYLYQPFFAQQLGVFSKSPLSPEKVDEFIRAIPVEYKYVDIKLNSFNNPEAGGYELIPNKNHVLDLIHEYDRISKKYSGQTKRNLKTAQKSSLTLLKNDKPESVISLFRENRGQNLKKWNDAHYNKLKHLMYSSIYKGRGVVYSVYGSSNNLNAAAFFLKGGNRIIFLFSGSDQVARENAAMTFLIDSVIREYTPSPGVFDFEGSNDANLARFYKGFGAKEILYSGLRMNRMGFPMKQVFRLYKKIKDE